MNTPDILQAASRVAEMARSSFLEATNLASTERERLNLPSNGGPSGDSQRAYQEERMRYLQSRERLEELYHYPPSSDTYPDSLSSQEYEQSLNSLLQRWDADWLAIDQHRLDNSLMKPLNSPTSTSQKPLFAKLSEAEKEKEANSIFYRIKAILEDWRNEFINEPQKIEVDYRTFLLLAEFIKQIHEVTKEEEKKQLTIYGIPVVSNKTLIGEIKVIASKKYSVD